LLETATSAVASVAPASSDATQTSTSSEAMTPPASLVTAKSTTDVAPPSPRVEAATLATAIGANEATAPPAAWHADGDEHGSIATDDARPVPAAITPTAIDAPLTGAVEAPSRADAPADVEGTARERVRTRVREARLDTADARAIAREVHGDVDLGEAGRVAVHAAHGARSLDVRVSADVADTARAIAENAHDLAKELRNHATSPRVIVNGHVAGGGGSGGGQRDRSAPARDDEDGARERSRPRARRVRIVL
jgi:hypothetical protein